LGFDLIIAPIETLASPDEGKKLRLHAERYQPLTDALLEMSEN